MRTSNFKPRGFIIQACVCAVLLSAFKANALHSYVIQRHHISLPLPQLITVFSALLDQKSVITASNNASITSRPTIQAPIHAIASSSPTPSSDRSSAQASTKMLHYAQTPYVTLTPEDKVLLAGDSLMQGIAPFIGRDLRKKGGISSLDLSKQSTGLIYTKTFNWPQTIADAIEKEGITVVVIFLGANDPWDLSLEGKFEYFGSERWKRIYKQRVSSIIENAHAHQVKVLWLELPPMKSPPLKTGQHILNQLFKEAVEQHQARWVKTEFLLTDTPGEYNKFKNNIEGKPISVRSDDGVHLTPSGQRLVAAHVMEQFKLPTISHASVTK